MHNTIFPAQVCTLVILKQGIAKLEKSKNVEELNKIAENENTKKIGLSLLNYGIQKIIVF